MSGRVKGAPADSAEAARAARRELHEEIQEAREVLRELRAVQGESAAAVRERIAVLETWVNGEVEQVEKTLTENGERIQTAIARLLGSDTPAKLLETIVGSLLDDIKPAMIKAIGIYMERELGGLVTSAVQELAEDGLSKYSARSSLALEAARVITGQPIAGRTGRSPLPRVTSP